MMKLLKKFMTILAVSRKINSLCSLENVSEYLCICVIHICLKNFNFS